MNLPGNRVRSIIGLIALLATSSAFGTDYRQAPGSTLAFATKFQGEVFVGSVPGFITQLRFDPARLQDARLDVAMPLADVSIDNADGTETLRGPEFFNVAKFPQARFSATRFRSLRGNRYAAEGTLTLRGVSRPVTLEFTWTAGAQPVLAGTATVKRLDFNVGAGEWADVQTIPNEVAISTRVLLVLVKRPAGPPR